MPELSSLVSPSPNTTPARPSDTTTDVYGLTHPGKVRKSNQDHFLIATLEKHLVVRLSSLPAEAQPARDAERVAFLALVADGVGGGSGGEEASRVATDVVTRFATEAAVCYYQTDSDDPEAFGTALATAVEQADVAVRLKAENVPSLSGMATTLTLFMSIWPHAYILQVGDSRAYQLRDGVLRQLTRDQTMAQDLVDQGILPASQAPSTRWARVLSSAIGGSESAPTITRVEQQWGDVGLLCTDGLYRHVSDEKIKDRLTNMTSSKQVSEALLQDALDDGGTDNITIIVGRTLKPE